MFLKRNKYTAIPEEYQLLFTDDFLVHSSNNVYVLNTNKITGSMCTSLDALAKNESLLARINKDIINGKNKLLKNI
jgi:hypothetical protein